MTNSFNLIWITKKFNMEKHDWMNSTRYHERMTERFDLNIGVWQGDETIQLREKLSPA
jgi:hypothetical protein